MKEMMMSQQNLPKKQETGGPYYDYVDQNILNVVKEIEANLPEDAEKLIEMRNKVEKMEDVAAHNLGGDWQRGEIEGFDPFWTAVDRITDPDKKEKTKEVRHGLLDIMHAINRKLDKLGHVEK